LLQPIFGVNASVMQLVQAGPHASVHTYHPDGPLRFLYQHAAVVDTHGFLAPRGQAGPGPGRRPLGGGP
jgi:hypothetical protein